ncbi:FtsW/RodA/SpoVE family cell cycle protein [Treponema sp.]|uniref:FtsW/RodA/SpoVE family cell cycle protein n=1 Tax=Treponema sp. TaxID=166 RepID=UPI0025FE740F|nr:putative peptidoglycan glycosyltransferase FtsW [Treponema sp.]MBR4321000.1 cell division protein FtsW [Treponema sp.]
MNFSIVADRPLENYKKCDISLILLSVLLWGIGMFTLYVCSGNYGMRAFNDDLYFVKRQMISSCLGFMLFIIFATFKLETIKRFLPLMVVIALVLSIMTFIPGIGIERNGARRWIRLGFTTFQPSEMVKFVIVLYLANYFEKQSKITDAFDKTVFPAVLVSFVLVASIAMQSDLSTSVFVAALAILLFIVSGAKIFWLLPVMSILIPLSVLFVFLEPYRLNRIIGFLDQDSYLQTLNYQTYAARRAISAGGFWGQGLGSGLSRINSIPEIQSDYIFAGWAESMGYFGVLIYFAILILFAWRGLHCAMTTKSRFAAIASFGFIVSIVAQSVMNVAVVGGVIPTTGIPLPFFSSGGSSILFTLATCGFLVNASRNEIGPNDDIEIEEIIYE